VIDKENLICETCRVALGNLGHEVFCTDERQAAGLAEKNSFDLAVVNSTSGDVTGVEVFERLRRTNPILAGVLVTSNASLDMLIDALNKGFSKVCKTPLDAGRLVEAVNETLNISSLREDITRMKILLPLYKLGQRFIAAESEQAICEELVDAVAQEMGVPSVSVMMFDDASGSLKVVAYCGLIAEYVEDLQIRPGEKIAGKVFLSRQPAVLNQVRRDESPYHEFMNREEITAAISFPITRKGKVLGVLNISKTKSGELFSEADIEMLSIIVGQAMMALEIIRSSREREENCRVRALLEQYVSPEVSDMLVKNKQDLLDVGCVQQLTVLFADIRKFTLLVQYLDPVQLRIFLNSFFDMFGNIVFSCQGMLDKFMGDAALVIFGAPVQAANPNVAAVSAAHRIMAEFQKLRLYWEQKNEVFAKIGLGIGISRGPMFLGNIGSAKRLDYTVIGPDVNIAQRLASETESGQILITSRVHANLAGKFPVRSENSMLLRGMESRVTVYSI